MTRTLVLLVLTLVVTLASLGVAYGLWSKTLQVGGTVTTGNLDAEWTVGGCFEKHGWPGPFQSGEYLGKDVGSVSTEIDTADPRILHFTVENGYPSYVADCEIEYNNSGSIPWMVESIEFVPGPNLTGCTVQQSPTEGSFTATCDQLTVTFIDGLCTQIDPGDLWGIAGSLRIHVEQPAKERTPYTFDVEVLVVQWNESQCWQDEG